MKINNIALKLVLTLLAPIAQNAVAADMIEYDCDCVSRTTCGGKEKMNAYFFPGEGSATFKIKSSRGKKWAKIIAEYSPTVEVPRDLEIYDGYRILEASDVDFNRYRSYVYAEKGLAEMSGIPQGSIVLSYLPSDGEDAGRRPLVKVPYSCRLVD